jgi:large subunit ribosomal protein L3
MIRGLIGKKLGMTQIFNKEGDVIPVTVVEAGPCTVLEIKEAPAKVKLGFEAVKESRVKKPQLGYFKKLGVSPMRTVKEFESSDNKDYKVGQEVKVDVFKAGEYVDVTGLSIGKGFQGGMKRHHWAGGKATHGSMHHRRVGSISSSAEPSRVLKGRTMPGHMGDETVTIQSLRVIAVDTEKNLVLVKGAIPGCSRGTVFINRSKKRAYKDLDAVKVVVAHKVNPMKQAKAGGAGAAKKPAAKK